MIFLFLLQTSWDEQIVEFAYRPANEKLGTFYFFKLGHISLLKTSKMWIHRLSTHQYLSQGTGEMK